MTQIHLDVIATVPKVAQCDFIDATLRAKANCPISRSLNANISMRANLKRRPAAVRILPRAGAAGRGLTVNSKQQRKMKYDTKS